MTRVADFRDLTSMPPPPEIVEPYEAFGDALQLPRRIAAEIIAADGAHPVRVVDVGSFTGELLEAFLDRFPDAYGQWTDATDNSMGMAQARLGRFGDRVTYVVGAPGRDVSDGSVPSDTDVLMTSWLSSHRPADRVPVFYRDAAALLAPGGWLVHLEHVAPVDEAWERRILAARALAHVTWEGPPAHHDGPIASRAAHLDAIRAAGLDDVDVVWESLGTALFLARKHD